MLAKYEVGKIVQETAFVGTDVVRPYGGGNVWFSIYSKTGKLVQDVSASPTSEAEVLFPPGSQFRVLERYQLPGSSEWHISLTDVSPGAP